MSDYSFDVSYRVGTGEVLEVQSVALSPVPPGRSKTGSDDCGNIIVGKGDTATIVYGCDTVDSRVAASNGSRTIWDDLV
jgi:hypothetical protein